MDRAFHPLADIFPLLIGPEFDELTADVREHGLREPIVLLNEAILDGRNRYRACTAAGIEPRFTTYIGDDPKAFVVSLNLHRRHLDESQRGLVAAKLANLEQGRPMAEKGANLPLYDERPITPISQADAAKLLNVSKRTVKSGSAVIAKGIPDLVQAVEQGRVTVSAAAEVAKLPVETQREITQRPKLPTAAEARKIAKEQGISVPARDGKLYNGRTIDQEKADAEASRRAGALLHPLEEIVAIGMTPAEYFASLDVPRFGRFLDDDMDAAWRKAWPWFEEFNAIWRAHRAA